MKKLIKMIDNYSEKSIIQKNDIKVERKNIQILTHDLQKQKYDKRSY